MISLTNKIVKLQQKARNKLGIQNILKKHIIIFDYIHYK